MIKIHSFHLNVSQKCGHCYKFCVILKIVNKEYFLDQYIYTYILVLWLGCQYLDTECDGSNSNSISMLGPSARHLIHVASVDSDVK